MQLADAITAWTAAHGHALSASTQRDIDNITEAVTRSPWSTVACRDLPDEGRLEIAERATQANGLSGEAIGQFLDIVIEWGRDRAPDGGADTPTHPAAEAADTSLPTVVDATIDDDADEHLADVVSMPFATDVVTPPQVVDPTPVEAEPAPVEAEAEAEPPVEAAPAPVEAEVEAEPPVDAAPAPVEAEAEPPVDAAPAPVEAEAEPPVEAEAEPPGDAAPAPVEAEAEPPADAAPAPAEVVPASADVEPPVDAAPAPVEAEAEPPADAAPAPVEVAPAPAEAVAEPPVEAEPPVDAAPPEPSPPAETTPAIATVHDTPVSAPDANAATDHTEPVPLPPIPPIPPIPPTVGPSDGSGSDPETAAADNELDDQAAATSFLQTIDRTAAGNDPFSGELTVAAPGQSHPVDANDTPAAGVFSAAAEADDRDRSIDWITVMLFTIAAVCFGLVIFLYFSA